VADAALDLARRWGEAPWRVALDPPRAEIPERSEVAVVGGGFAGLAAALALARGGARVHVLEARRIGDGASGRSGGIALEGTAIGPLEGVEDCLAGLSDLVRAHAIECDLELGGCWEMRHAPGGERGQGVRSWPDTAAGRLVVDRAVPGGALDPGALLAGLGAAALRAGAVLVEGARVEDFEPGPPLRLRVGEASVSAERALFAIDALPSGLVGAADVRPALTLAVATEPLPLALLAEIGLGATPFYTIDLPYLWGRATRDGRLVVGAGLAFDPDGDLERVSLEQPDVRDVFARLEGRVRGLHPALARAAITHRWGGPIGFRAARAPLFAELAPGLVVAGGYAGHGVALSIRLGLLAAARFQDGGALPGWGAP
jgi:gamma-glutamylputrescine oxidase